VSAPVVARTPNPGRTRRSAPTVHAIANRSKVHATVKQESNELSVRIEKLRKRNGGWRNAGKFEGVQYPLDGLLIFAIY